MQLIVYFTFLIKDNTLFSLKTKRQHIGDVLWGRNQESKVQRSRKIGKEEQEKWEKTTLHSKRVCKKKDLISSKERSQPFKLLAFLSCQMHQIKQWGTNLQTSMWWCHTNLPCQASNNSRTVWGITQWIPNKQKTKDHNS